MFRFRGQNDVTKYPLVKVGLKFCWPIVGQGF